MTWKIKTHYRTICSKYNKEGIQFVIHKGTDQTPSHKIFDGLKNRVQTLIKDKYSDFNLTHLQEKLEEGEGILVKRETLRKWAHEINLVKRPKKRRGTVRKRRDRMPSPGYFSKWMGASQMVWRDKKLPHYRQIPALNFSF